MSRIIKRNVEVAVQITPEELADAFWDMWQNEQAEFFNRLSGFEGLVFQLQAIADDPTLTDEGRHAMGRIGEYATRENNHGS